MQISSNPPNANAMDEISPPPEMMMMMIKDRDSDNDNDGEEEEEEENQQPPEPPRQQQQSTPKAPHGHFVETSWSLSSSVEEKRDSSDASSSQTQLESDSTFSSQGGDSFQGRHFHPYPSSHRNSNHHHRHRNAAPFLYRLRQHELFGRAREINLLQKALRQVVQSGTSRVVWISGVSGVGKTSLVMEAFATEGRRRRHNSCSNRGNGSNNNGNKHRSMLLPLSSNHNQHVFVSGKFDSTRQNSAPFSALLEAFADLYSLTEAGRNQDYFNDHSSDDTSLGKRFQEMVPQMLSISHSGSHHRQEQEHPPHSPSSSGNDNNNNNNSMMDMASSSSAFYHDNHKNLNHEYHHHHQLDSYDIDNTAATMVQPNSSSFRQFQQLCTILLRSSATAEQPVVLFLDDLQWADKASLQVLESLIYDKESKHVLIVGAYRQDDPSSSKNNGSSSSTNTIYNSSSSNKALRALVRKTTRESSGKLTLNDNESTPATTTATTTTEETATDNSGSPTGPSLSSPSSSSSSTGRLLKRPVLRRASSSKRGTFGTASSTTVGTRIAIRELSVDALHTMVTSLTQRLNDQDATRELSRVVWSKTHGNAYFVVQFLRMLVHQRLLVLLADEQDYDAAQQQQQQTSLSPSQQQQQQQRRPTPRRTMIRQQSSPILRETPQNVYLATKPYMWDIERVQRETVVTDNVADVLAKRIQQLALPIQTVLKLAAFLGYNIQLDVLLAVLKEYKEIAPDSASASSSRHHHHHHHHRAAPNTKWTRTELSRMLNVASKVGLIEKRQQRRPLSAVREEGTGGQQQQQQLPRDNSSRRAWMTHQYKFTHDRVRTVLYELVPNGEDRELLHLQIGRTLQRTVSKSNEDWLVPVIADHLNRGGMHMTHLMERMNLVHLNLHVAKNMMAKYAFLPALEYVKFGIALLGDEYLWTYHYQLALDLFNTLAEARRYSGDIAGSRREIESIVARTQNDDNDSLRPRCVLVDILGAEGKPRAARDLAFSVLEGLGVQFPKKIKKRNVVLEFLKIQRTLRGHAPRQYLLDLKVSNDPHQTTVMRLLSSIVTHAFLDDLETNTFSFVGLQLMRLTLDSGVTEWSPCGIAAYAVVLAAVGKHAESCEMGHTAMQLSDRLGRRPNEGRHLLYLDHLVLHWQRPLIMGLTAFPRCYYLSVQNSDIDTGLCATTGYLATAFHFRPLPEVETSCRRSVRQLYELGHEMFLSVNLPLWQLALNMMGRSEDPLLLSGEVMDFPQFQAAVASQPLASAKHLVDGFHLMMAFHLNAYDRMKELLPHVTRASSSLNPHFAEYLVTFFVGLSYFSLYREQRLSKYRRLGCKSINRLKAWVQQGVPTCRPLCLLLQAVHTSFDKKMTYAKVAPSVDKAIKAIHDEALLPYEAIANEQAALIALDCDCMEDAKEHMRRSLELQEVYGFRTKVDWMNEEYSNLLRREDR